MFRKLNFIALILALAVIVLGSWYRISGLGAGCPDWPGCFGQEVPDLPQLAEGTGNAVGTVNLARAMPHIYLAGALGLTVLVLAGLAFTLRENRWRAFRLSLFAALLVALQGGMMGMLAHRLPLMPLLITAHFILGLGLLGTLYRLYRLTGPQVCPTGNVTGLRWLSRLGMLLLLVQTALGVWVSTHSAGLSCPDFPTCQGSWLPDTDFRTVLNGMLNPVADQLNLLSASVRAGIHVLHRFGGVLVFVLLTMLAMGCTSNRKVPGLSKSGLILSFLLLLQIALGIGLVLLRLPAVLVVAHDLLTVLLWLSVIHIHYFLALPSRQRESLPERKQQARATPQLEKTPVAPPVIPTTLPETTRVAVPQEPAKTGPSAEGLFDRLRHQLGKTRGGVTGFLGTLALGRKTIDREFLEDLEAQLLTADIGVTATQDIIGHLTESLDRQELADIDVVKDRLRTYLSGLIEPVSQPLQIPDTVRPFVILVVGVNGVGKTTTIGKLAKRLQNQGHSVMLAAGDTFRAAAVEQLQTWGERNQVPVIAQHTGADSASVIYDALQAAQSRGIDVLIADTAGRLHNKSNLMEELSKIRRIMARLDPTAPHEVLLVLDAGTGQNALNQARQFNEAVGLTGIALTKLDGTAKGGVLFALASQFGLPIRFIGIGEGIDDLQDFDASRFIDALFADSGD